MRTVVSRECGYARNASESDYPHIWRGVEGWWCPHISQRGELCLRDLLNRNNGLFNSMETSDWVLNRHQRGLQFDGSESVRISRGFAYPQMTQSVWFRRASTSVTSCFVGTGIPLTVTASNDRFVIQPWSDGQVYVAFRGSVWGNFASNDLNLHHLAAVYDGTKSTNADRLTVYYDGKRQSLSFTGTIPVSIGTPTQTAIGETYAGTVETYGTGFIFDYRVFSRALAASECLLLAKAPTIGLELSTKSRSTRVADIAFQTTWLSRQSTIIGGGTA